MKKWIKYAITGAILGTIWGISSYMAGYLPLPSILNFLLGVPLSISALVVKPIFGENLLLLFLFPIPIGILISTSIGLVFYLIER